MSEKRRTLVLMRHAKSAYPDEVADHDRPLAPRGEREAGLAGDWLRAGPPVDPPVQAVLCSSATRTRQTLQRTGIEAPVHITDRLYGASPGAVIAEINAAETTFGFDMDTLLVIGHEPTTSALALALSGAPGTNATAAEHISVKYPTSALAVLHVNGSWAEVELGSAALTAFHIPR
ncbi:SixA phosphatase family protein [[Mycobacterium] burgundiense]|uniref:Histidine phosphatase family protein n=1 Tax=[Mycobacterium] burgundiense TaxID=3064286 RepID=A0ABM9LGE8_9MYCO|nr:histidine phosphatase family protein [Mycolicibacterium sp. MU0053]CAJ1498640.1 histidine phosphatase family protein [Mycolicibacterium sp. MU0053]